MNFPSHFENVLDMAAKTALDVFRLECLYYYEDRKTGQRYPVECIEKTIEMVETDSNGMTFVRTGKGFLVSRANKEAVDAWRSGLNIDVQKEPTPFGGDYIVRCAREQTEWYEITHREPYTLIAPNRALYRINTIFAKKAGTLPVPPAPPAEPCTHVPLSEHEIETLINGVLYP